MKWIVLIAFAVAGCQTKGAETAAEKGAAPPGAPGSGPSAHGSSAQAAQGANPHAASPHGANPHGANPHGANPHAANPHAASPHGANPHAAPADPTPITRPDEPHLANLRMLTNGGENAEAYFDANNRELIFQSTQGGLECDQIFRMNADGTNMRRVSTGTGRTTCSFIQLDGSIIYASTHGHGPGCMWKPDHSRGYVWPLYPEMDLWRAGPNGENPAILFQSPGYDAEATICPKDGRIVFTSSKDGDLELYSMDKDGKNIVRLTHTPGYDGGAFYSPDCSKIVWRASRPTGADLEDFQKNLKDNLVRPTKLEIFLMNADGTGVQQVTKNGAANFAPYMHPDNEHILFASNLGDPRGRNFDIFLIHADGSGLQQVTHNPTFDGFPMWSHDGKRLVFASNRGNAKHGETNIFIADWIW